MSMTNFLRQAGIRCLSVVLALNRCVSAGTGEQPDRAQSRQEDLDFIKVLPSQSLCQYAGACPCRIPACRPGGRRLGSDSAGTGLELGPSPGQRTQTFPKRPTRPGAWRWQGTSFPVHSQKESPGDFSEALFYVPQPVLLLTAHASRIRWLLFFAPEASLLQALSRFCCLFNKGQITTRFNQGHPFQGWP